jgi:hypothetical protein
MTSVPDAEFIGRHRRHLYVNAFAERTGRRYVNVKDRRHDG